MTSDKRIKERVRDQYAARARKVKESGEGCCGPGDTSEVISVDLYTPDEVGELPREAGLASLGCGTPVAVAELREGEVVLDLGSGGGIDVLLSAKRVGSAGKAYGLDMTDEMLELAREEERTAGVAHAEVLKGARE